MRDKSFIHKFVSALHPQTCKSYYDFDIYGYDICGFDIYSYDINGFGIYGFVQ